MWLSSGCRLAFSSLNTRNFVWADIEGVKDAPQTNIRVQLRKIKPKQSAKASRSAPHTFMNSTRVIASWPIPKTVFDRF
jgi:hypothetical protein